MIFEPPAPHFHITFAFFTGQPGRAVGVNLTYLAKEAFSVGRTPETAAEAGKCAAKRAEGEEHSQGR